MIAFSIEELIAAIEEGEKEFGIDNYHLPLPERIRAIVEQIEPTKAEYVDRDIDRQLEVDLLERKIDALERKLERIHKLSSDEQ